MMMASDGKSAETTGVGASVTQLVGGIRRCLIERASSHITALHLVIGGLTLFAPLIEGGTTQGPVMVIRLALLGALAYWLISGLRMSTLTIPRTALWWPVAGFVSLAGLSVLWSAYANVSLQWFLSIMLYAVFFGIVLLGVDNGKRLRGVVMLMLAMGLFEGGLGIVQHIWLDEPRAKGTFFNPNFFATYEISSAVLALGLLVGGGGFRRTEKLLLALVVVISCLAVLLAQSRGATVAFLVAVAFVGFTRYGKATLIVLLILVLVGIIVPNPLNERIIAVSKYDPFAYTRLEMWKSSLDRIVDHPIGIGLGMYKFASFQYRFPFGETIVRYGKRAESAHNEYLQLAVELGIAGLAVFLVGIGIWASEAKRLFSGTLSPRERGMVVGCSAGVLAILAHAGVDSVFHEPSLVLLLILQGGLVLALRRCSRPQQEGMWCIPFPSSSIKMTLVSVVIALLSLLVIQPAVAWFMFNHGNSVFMTEGNSAAMKWYRYASITDPSATAIRDGLSRTYIQQFRLSGDPIWLREAVGEMEAAMALNPLDGRVPYRLGTIYMLLAEQPTSAAQRDQLIAQAAQAFEKAIFVDPFSPFGYFELSKLRRGQGNNPAAWELLERAIAYEPNFIPARAMLADLAKNTGQTEIADLHLAAIRDIRSKYQGWTLTPLEQQFLGMSTPKS
ncbi:MAG: O-antigen ligase family protein [Nitrospira sp.]|nr:O-antigen ligase family protein [Nitrospira sp.]